MIKDSKDIYQNKKLLVLGGAQVHVKLIKAAQKLGAYVIATDNVDYSESPGKKAADEYWDNDIYDIAGIVEKAKSSGIDAVIAGWLDPCQRPYHDICEALGLPCYGTKEQFFKLTDKAAFKELCRQNGVETIPEYSDVDIKNKVVNFPVFVKPSDSRGSRGQFVCYNYEELEVAVECAKQESSNEQAIVEKYIQGSQEFHVTYFFVDGTPYLVRTSDNYCGSEENNMQKVVSCAIMPSAFTDKYIRTAHQNVVSMFKNLGLQNGPVFMQGFIDGDAFRFFDPGLRFPGVDFEMVFEEVFGVSLMEAMVEIAFKGKSSVSIPQDAVYLGGNRGSVLYLTVKAGRVKNILGAEDVRKMNSVISFWTRVRVGDTIEWKYNVNQRLAEVDLLAEDTCALLSDIKKINSTVVCLDDYGEDMVFERFDTSRVKR